MVNSKLEQRSCHDKQTHTINLIGQTFGRLTVVARSEKKTKDGNLHWLCRCSCGHLTTVNGYRLRRGDTKSCGCLRREVSKKTSSENLGFLSSQRASTYATDERGVSLNSLVVSKRNKSGQVGVSFDKSSGKYVARLRFKGKYVLNKQAIRFEDAVRLRLAAESQYFGISAGKSH
ncbi:hypothetical protein [Paucilactobacillus sp. N302-9]